MKRTTYEALENLSLEAETIISTMSILASGISNKTADRTEITGCIALLLRAMTEFKDEFDETIYGISDTEVLE